MGVAAAAAWTQFRQVCSTHPNSLAAAPAVSPSLTRFTAKSLNSAVSSCLGIFIVLPFMVTARRRHPWATKFRGNLRIGMALPLSNRDTVRRAACRAGVSQGTRGSRVTEVPCIRSSAHIRVVVALVEYPVALCQSAIRALETHDHAQLLYEMDSERTGPSGERFGFR